MRSRIVRSVVGERKAVMDLEEKLGMESTERPSPLANACCDDDCGQNDVLGGIADEEIGEGLAAIRAAGFRLLLDTGMPVDQAAWAAAAGLDSDAFAEALCAGIGRGRVELDDAGGLVGIAGLTVNPTRHRLEIGQVTRWTWCALDAVGILGALSANGAVLSVDPGTGEDIEIVFRDGVPQGNASMFIAGGYDGGNVVESWCPLVNFFATSDDARSWAASQGFDGDVVSVTGVVGEAAEMWKPVVKQNTSQDDRGASR
jgi:alkylmercury lyase